MTNMDINIQQAQQAPSQMDLMRPTLRCITIKLSKAKNKEKILKVGREKPINTYRGASVGPPADFSSDTGKAARQRDDTVKTSKRVNQELHT